MFGADGLSGTVAGAIVVETIVCCVASRSTENWSATAASCGPTALAMSAACCGSSERAVTLRIDDSPDTSADTSSGVPGDKPSFSRSGSITAGERRTAT